jgi:prepilin-type N-terminal cleavage/methylation domain-containing protein
MGFSLIELLVSIGVILILVSISFAGYSKLTIKQNLTSAGLLMKNVIRDAQSRAFNSEIDCSKCSCSPSSGSTFVGWVLNFTTKSIYGLCGASTTFSNTSFTLPQGIALTTTSDPIIFNSSTYTVKTTTNNSAIICLYNPNVSNNFYRITLNTAGVIEEKIDTVCP